MDIKLLPCPFCGTDAEFHPYKNNGLTLKCKTVSCVSRSQRVMRYSLEWLQEKMTEQWNTRQQLAQQPSNHIGDVNNMINPSVDVLVEALKDAQECISRVELLPSDANYDDVERANTLIEVALAAYEAKPINESVK